nr:M1 family aminopeptidase [uncultured Undibacterium sp.]
MQSLLGFELYFAVKQRMLIVLALLAFAYGFFINSQQIGEGMEQLALNSPYRISYFLILVSIILTFVVTLFSITVLLKDQEHRFASVIEPLSKRPLLVSRWITIVGSSVLISFCLILGMLAALLVADANPAKLQPLKLGDFAWPWLVVILPNILLVSAILIAVTTRWRNAKISYCCSLLLVALAGTALIVIKAPISGESLLSTSAWTPFFALVDPFAASAFFEQTQFWLPQQKNQQWFQLSGPMLLNRIWVSALSLLLFGYLWRKAKTSQLPQSRPQISAKPSATPTDTHANLQHVMPTLRLVSVPQNLSAAHYWLSTLSQQVAFYTGQLLANWPIRILLLLWWGMVLIGILMAAGVFSSDEFSGKYITSAGLIRQAGEAFAMFSRALLVFIIAECIWQERELKVADIVFSTPLSSTSNFLAKLFGTMSIPLVMLILMLGSCIMYQATVVDSSIEWTLYGVSCYYFLLPTFYHAVLIFFIQTLIAKTNANKYLAMAISAGVLISLSQLLQSAGNVSVLWQLNKFPDLSRDYSALASFAGHLEQFNLLAMFWGVLVLAIALISQRWWLRKERLAHKAMPAFKAGFIFFGAFALLASWLHWNLPAQARLKSADVQSAARADYEKSYRAFATLPHPEFSQTSVTLDIYPEQGLVNIQSHNQITNHFNQPITSILVTTKQPLQNISIETGRIAEQKSAGLWYTYRIELSQPMQPSAQLTLNYSLQMRSQTFAINRGIVANGVYFHQGEFEPLLGYAAMLEISDSFSRKEFGLAEKTSVIPSLTTQKRAFSTTLSTTRQQTALTSGELVRQWQQGGRSYFQYEMPQKIYPVVGYFSAHYQRHQITAGDIPITIYFHPEHERNVAEIAKAATFTLETMQRQFGDYPYSSLRIIEVPHYHPFGGRASAGIVALNETLFLQDYQDGAAINNVARNTIHEVAHQWFGEKLTPKITRGEKVLTESIAKEIEASVLGQMYGASMQTSLMAFNLRRYQSGRAFAHQDQTSLLNLDQQEYIAYGKGPIVMQALKKHLGDEQYHAVLRNFIEQHQHDMQATLPELVALFAEKSPSPDYVHRLFGDMGFAAQAK